MPSTFNGIGTSYVGKTDFNADGSYITTEWFTFLYVPLVPLRSRRVVESGETSFLWLGVYSSSSDGYYLLESGPPKFRQVVSVYLYVLFLWYALDAMPSGMSTVDQWLWIAGMAAVPFVVRTWARVRRRRLPAYRGDLPDDDTIAALTPHLERIVGLIGDGNSDQRVATLISAGTGVPHESAAKLVRVLRKHLGLPAVPDTTQQRSPDVRRADECEPASPRVDSGTAKTALRTEMMSEYVCSDCGAGVREQDTSCPNCGECFSED